MMLLIGMWISLTKKPIKPIMAKPIAVAKAIFLNSLRSGLVHFLTRRYESLKNCFPGSTNLFTWSIIFDENYLKKNKNTFVKKSFEFKSKSNTKTVYV